MKIQHDLVEKMFVPGMVLGAGVGFGGESWIFLS